MKRNLITVTDLSTQSREHIVSDSITTATMAAKALYGVKATMRVQGMTTAAAIYAEGRSLLINVVPTQTAIYSAGMVSPEQKAKTEATIASAKEVEA